ncbi:MAG: DUF1428 domain-containing protein [Alphaproteobacteria bacterium]|nr:DUF1428 domain-containing protein [Alphaproteobacteria bacterium]
MTYVDGFLIPVHKDKIDLYKQLATKAAKIWIEYGALDFKENVAEDTNVADGMLSFSKVMNPKQDEIVVFSFIVFKSRAHRDEVNAKVMADQRLKDECKDMPFDFERMVYGGFETIVDLKGN